VSQVRFAPLLAGLACEPAGLRLGRRPGAGGADGTNSEADRTRLARPALRGIRQPAGCAAAGHPARGIRWIRGFGL